MKKSLLIMLSALCVTQASAAIHVVTSNGDTGPGTLRALTGAAASGDTIMFSTATNGIFMLVSEISVSQDLTIIGNGTGNTILDGGRDVKDA